MHSDYFPTFLLGKRADLKYRLDLIDSLFHEKLPDLYEHFNSLQIDLSVYLSDYLSTLFVKVLDFDVVSRIWDNFFLEGEIYAFKVCLAILMCWERQFLHLPKYKIEERLKDMHSGKSLIEDEVFGD